MAIFTSPLGDFRKTLGNTVMLINDGVNIVRKKASQVKDRKSSSQLQQRAKFTTLTQTAKTLQRTLKLGYTSLDVLTGPRAQFVKENTDCVTVSAENVCTIDYSKLIVSKGALPTYYMNVSYDSELEEYVFSQTPFDFDNEEEVGAFAYAVLYNTERQQEKCIKLKELVTGGDTIVQLPDGWTATNVKVYTFTRNDKLRISSKSVYHAI